MRKNFFPLRVTEHWNRLRLWRGLWSLLPWRCSKSTWMKSCAACSRWPCFGRGVGLDDPQRSLPTPTVLSFCETCRRPCNWKGSEHIAFSIKIWKEQCFETASDKNSQLFEILFLGRKSSKHCYANGGRNIRSDCTVKTCFWLVAFLLRQ